jgi:hypothetical protein
VVVRPVLAFPGGNAEVPLVERDLSTPDGEGPGDGDLMRWLFVDGFGGSHFELAGGHHDHF